MIRTLMALFVIPLMASIGFVGGRTVASKAVVLEERPVTALSASPAAEYAAIDVATLTANDSKLAYHGTGKRHIVTAWTRESLIPIGQLHDWVVEIRTPEDEATKPLGIQISGGMRAHGHGLPSRPLVERHLGDGRWLVSGMLFNMAGPWQLALRITDEFGDDDVVLHVPVGTLSSAPDPSAVSSASLSWSSSERIVLGSMVRSTLEMPRSPVKPRRVGDLARPKDEAIADLGKELFFDTGLSRYGNRSCATCHQPELDFTDGLRTAVGARELSRNTPSVIDSGYQEWLYWDGRRDSLWSQALVPIEAADELGSDRVSALRHVRDNRSLNTAYQDVFGQLPLFEGLPDRASPAGDTLERKAWEGVPPLRRLEIDTAFSNLGKAIAAYERTLVSGTSRFDRFVQALLSDKSQAAEQWLSRDEQQGLKHLIDPANGCMNCHNGPLLSNRGFHNIGTSEDASGTPDFGRLIGVQSALLDEFNCRSAYAEGARGDCELLEAAQRTEIGSLTQGAFKVPGLRNVARTAPYMHDGRFSTLREVIEHYRQPPDSYSEIRPLPLLSDLDIEHMVAFFESLNTISASPASPASSASPASPASPAASPASELTGSSPTSNPDPNLCSAGAIRATAPRWGLSELPADTKANP